ncbi:MAG: hypothetical protein OFPII_39250 [Osedax symbiont Rs1]|nr:MAG: hypothetical protein OFPII_39250 [Osedax symbiont Rs1]
MISRYKNQRCRGFTTDQKTTAPLIHVIFQVLFQATQRARQSSSQY